MNALRMTLGKQADLALVACVVAILLLLFTPIPAALLDLLIIVNLAFALAILLLTFYVAQPVDFSTFPSLLLLATLFRLSLSIAATRLILSKAQAGHVIAAIGKFVVQGNFVIGFIVFLILVVVQYIVVTGGAQRVSEVAARFALDGMPGQQMSIDADLNMGLIDQAEAQRRRKSLEKEAGFYGAMDGASKFVKGDAIAGILILLINVLAGWIVGIAQMGMGWQQALQTFTLLTIGDGIVTQVPALIISVATGLIVTRSSSDQQLGIVVGQQLFRFPKVQWLVSIAMLALLLLPGMPGWLALVIGPVMILGWLLRRTSAGAREEAGGEGAAQAAPETATFSAQPAPIEIGFGSVLGAALASQRPALAGRALALRQDIQQELGVMLPEIAFKEQLTLPPDDYRISLFGSRYGQAALYPERMMAIHASDNGESLPGVRTRDPAFGLPAVWMDAEETASAKRKGYTIVDPVTVLMTHLTEVIKLNLVQLVSRAAVVNLLDEVRARQPGLVEEMVPALLSVTDIQQVLCNLLAEHVSIRNMDRIAEVLVDTGRHEKDTARLGEAVRQRLGHQICQALRGENDALSVLTLDPALESRVLDNLRSAEDGAAGPVLEPALAEQLLSRLLAQTEAMMRQSQSPVLLCRPEIRRAIKLFTQRVVPRLAVVGVNEIPPSMNLRAFGVVNIN
ncbi:MULTISPECIES: flagellar biosynthesis protein FlhA [Cupriavidus]